uniref:Uncharacterized protein n=1 Tax=Rhizophora mucronata TaxID=61149 RepID=A0A2P2QHD2_RHIMU
MSVEGKLPELSCFDIWFPKLSFPRNSSTPTKTKMRSLTYSHCKC